MVGLLRLVSILILVLIVGLVAVIGLTSRTANRFAFLFTRPDGTACETPCLFGAEITMSFEQMDQMLSMSPVLKQATKIKNSTPSVIYQNHEMLVTARQNYGKVEFSSDFPTLIEVLVLLGKPERIGFAQGKWVSDKRFLCRSINLFLPGEMVILYTQSEGKCLTHLNRNITAIAILSYQSNYFRGTLPWRGLNAEDFYDSLQSP